jgi:hypothetical protein
MTNVTIHRAWELRQVGQPVEYIAERAEKRSVTIYRWLAGNRKWGIKGFIRH